MCNDSVLMGKIVEKVMDIFREFSSVFNGRKLKVNVNKRVQNFRYVGNMLSI